MRSVENKTKKGKSASFQRSEWKEKELMIQTLDSVINCDNFIQNITLFFILTLCSDKTPQFKLKVTSMFAPAGYTACWKYNIYIDPNTEFTYYSNYIAVENQSQREWLRWYKIHRISTLLHPQVSCNSARVSPTYHQCISSTKCVSWWSNIEKKIFVLEYGEGSTPSKKK